MEYLDLTDKIAFEDYKNSVLILKWSEIEGYTTFAHELMVDVDGYGFPIMKKYRLNQSSMGEEKGEMAKWDDPFQLIYDYDENKWIVEPRFKLPKEVKVEVQKSEASNKRQRLSLKV